MGRRAGMGDQMGSICVSISKDVHLAPDEDAGPAEAAEGLGWIVAGQPVAYVSDMVHFVAQAATGSGHPPGAGRCWTSTPDGSGHPPSGMALDIHGTGMALDIHGTALDADGSGHPPGAGGLWVFTRAGHSCWRIVAPRVIARRFRARFQYLDIS